jgi:hypothetical protein
MPLTSQVFSVVTEYPPDSTHYNPWVQKQGLDPEEIFKTLYECKLWQDPNADHTKYRGTSLPHMKFFLVDSEDELPRTVLPRYSYPGRQ